MHAESAGRTKKKECREQRLRGNAECGRMKIKECVRKETGQYGRTKRAGDRDVSVGKWRCKRTERVGCGRSKRENAGEQRV